MPLNTFPERKRQQLVKRLVNYNDEIYGKKKTTQPPHTKADGGWCYWEKCPFTANIKTTTSAVRVIR